MSRTKPTPVPADQVAEIVAEGQKPSPPVPTLGDQIMDIGRLVKNLSKELQMPLGTAFQITQLGLNYYLTLRQMQPPSFPVAPTTTEEPTDD